MRDKRIEIGVLPCVPTPASIGQKHRCSVLDLNSEHVPPGTTGFAWRVLDGVGSPATGIGFSVKNDQTFTDPVVFRDLKDGSTTPYKPDDGLYISDPTAATADFQVAVDALLPVGTSFPLESWMQGLGASIAGTRLCDLPMTGAHDAGSFGIAKSSPPEGGSSVPVSAGLLTGAARAQGWSWEQMSLAGARYFDVRLNRFPGVDGQLAGYYLTHTWIGQRFESALAAWARYCDEHPGELLVLDFQHQTNFVQRDHEAVAAAIESVLGDRLASGKDFGPTSTVGEFLASSARIVLVYEDTDANAPPPSFFANHPWAWPRSKAMRSIWGNQSSLQGLLNFLNQEIDNKPADKLWVLQCQVTMPVSDGLNLQDAAKTTNPAIRDWLTTTVANKAVNIVMIDWLQYGAVLDAVYARARS